MPISGQDLCGLLYTKPWRSIYVCINVGDTLSRVMAKGQISKVKGSTNCKMIFSFHNYSDLGEISAHASIEQGKTKKKCAKGNSTIFQSLHT